MIAELSRVLPGFVVIEHTNSFTTVESDVLTVTDAIWEAIILPASAG